MKSWTVLGYFSTDLKSNINQVDIWEWCLPIRSYIIFYWSVEGIQTDISLQTKLTHTFYPIFSFFPTNLFSLYVVSRYIGSWLFKSESPEIFCNANSILLKQS